MEFVDVKLGLDPRVERPSLCPSWDLRVDKPQSLMRMEVPSVFLLGRTVHSIEAATPRRPGKKENLLSVRLAGPGMTPFRLQSVLKAGDYGGIFLVASVQQQLRSAPGIKGKLALSSLDRFLGSAQNRDGVTRALGKCRGLVGRGEQQVLPPQRTASGHSPAPMAWFHHTNHQFHGLQLCSVTTR